MTEFLDRDKFKAGLSSEGSTTVPYPVLPDEAATKQFVLDQAAGYVAPVEVVVAAAEPGDPAVKIFVDTDDDTGQTHGVPIGAIIAYGGALAPTGWHLCDGSAHGSAQLQAVLGGANTPDLRDRFIVGTGPSYPRLSTGGAATHTLTVTEMPSHVHASPARVTYGGSFDSVAGGGAGTIYPGAVSMTAAGGGAAHNNMPPYYALIYIIKKV
jgi:microcystin-dependent protein